MAFIAIARVEGLQKYYQCRPHKEEKLNKERPDAYEERTWREKSHCNSKGNLIIPGSAFKNCIAEAAKYLSMQIPGKGKSTFTKHFEAGVMVLQDSVLPIKKEELESEWVFVPSDGVRGSGKRVYKRFPVISEGWQAEVSFVIIDETITKDVFDTHLQQAGMLIGIGSFRARNNGNAGRFKVLSTQWKPYVI